MENPDLKSLRIFENIGYAYFEADLSGRLTIANAPFCRAIGASFEQISGCHLSQFVEGSQAHKVGTLFNEIHLTGQSQRDIELNIKKQDGSLSIIEGAISLMLDVAGHPAGFQGVFHDINDRKRESLAQQHAREAAQRELEIGRRIQASFLPRAIPQPDGWEIDFFFQSAREVAGDFYDVFDLLGGKRVGLVVADVCDKGVGAAMFMGLFRSLIRAYADQHASLGWMDVLKSHRGAQAEGDSASHRRELLSTGSSALRNAITLTNNFIAKNHGDTSMFATVFFGVLDPHTGSLMYINGGHEPPIVLGPQGIKAHLEPTGTVVGIMPGLEFGIRQIDLDYGDMLFIFTDGVIDARGPGSEPFTERQLLSCIENSNIPVREFLNQIQGNLQRHMAGADQFDDITMLAVRRCLPASTN